MTERKKRGPNKCPKCKKEPAEPMHSCPYQSDINDNHEKFCKCCSSCTSDCVDEI